ncbi:hypothetical protein IFM89_030605 [Coptis chinensis]|uniref:Uncharacterized protein n=1 Tax=Coptis chinensis TaxID=261450 RepID=A0A835HQQ8_9MAGN|nr:hypothetical protein IFM89_030605 [Coptis chinensis]
MRVKYKNSVKDPGVQGVLIMNGDRFMFAPDDPTSVKLNVGVESIKQHLVSKKAALLNLTLDPAIIQGGYRSAMLEVADDKLPTTGGSNQVTVNLTVETIHQIFAEKPAVHLAYRKLDLQQYFDSQQANSLRTLGDAEIGTKPINLGLGTQKSFGSLKTVIWEMKENKFSDPVDRSGTRLRLPNSELLKHFWSSYPIPTTYLSTKVNRLKDAMSEIYPKLQGVKESVQFEFQHQVSLLVHPMLKSLDAAFLHYDVQAQR